MKSGDRVRYKGATRDQINWGHNADPRDLLRVGVVYTVSVVEVHSWHTKIFLKEMPGKPFNSVSFDEVPA